jgi:hypothetical protein
MPPISCDRSAGTTDHRRLRNRRAGLDDQALEMILDSCRFHGQPIWGAVSHLAEHHDWISRTQIYWTITFSMWMRRCHNTGDRKSRRLFHSSDYSAHDLTVIDKCLPNWSSYVTSDTNQRRKKTFFVPPKGHVLRLHRIK